MSVKGDIVRQAAANLQGRWVKGVMYRGEASCGLGHVQRLVEPGMAEGESSTTVEAARLRVDLFSMMHEVATEQYPDRTMAHGGFFPDFNDHEDTTEAEVVAIMEKVAVRLDEEIE